MRHKKDHETAFIPVDAGDGAPEFSHFILLDKLSDSPLELSLEADETARAGLVRRFDLLALDSLRGDVRLTRKGKEMRLSGELMAVYSQSCAVSSVPVPARLKESLELVFVPQPKERSDGADEEIELSEADLDVMYHDGRSVDLGEALAQSLGLLLDPFARAKGAEAAASQAGLVREDAAQVSEEGAMNHSPFAGLAALKNKKS